MGYGKKILTAEGRYFSLRPSVTSPPILVLMSAYLTYVILYLLKTKLDKSRFTTISDQYGIYDISRSILDMSFFFACIIWNYRWQPQMETRPDMRIIVSVSSAELLSRELGTLLTGRHLDVEMFPLDLSECMRFHGIDPEDPLEEPYLLFFIGTYLFQIEKKKSC